MGKPRPRQRGVTQLDHDPESLVWARKAAGVTQSWLSEQLGISAGHMSEIESGKRNLTPANLIRTANLLNCPRAVLARKYADTSVAS